MIFKVINQNNMFTVGDSDGIKCIPVSFSSEKPAQTICDIFNGEFSYEYKPTRKDYFIAAAITGLSQIATFSSEGIAENAEYIANAALKIKQ